MQLLFGYILNVENTDIVDFQHEQRRVRAFGFRRDIQLDRGFILVLGRAFLRIKIHLNLHIGLHVAGRALLCHDVFKRHIADELSQYAHLRGFGLLGFGFGHDWLSSLEVGI